MVTSSDSQFELYTFRPSYEVELDPELPGDGRWAQAVHAFDGHGNLVDDAVTTWGAPRYVLVRPSASDPWVGIFPHGGLGGADGVFAMPRESSLCVAVGGNAYIVDVDHPEDGAKIASSSSQQVAACAEPALLIVIGFSDMTAFNRSGVAWQSPDLVYDDLRVVGTRAGRILCTGFGKSDDGSLIEVDAHTGLPIPSVL